MSDAHIRADSRLADARSPFLRHGATQPVDWYPWGDEAFERARSTNRPVLLDIGAVWCHWCHVMDAESYDDPETAALINELFVPVKVDRDESPDVDARYQRAVQTMTGQGGWPLTAFLTPDGEVYYGGTYFPPDDRYGRPSFRHVLAEVARVWREEPQRARQAASGIRERLLTYARAEATSGEPAPQLIDEPLEELAHSFDFRHGGFGRAPKFPNAGALDLLLDAHLDTGSDWTLRIVRETLSAMADGGIYDQLGGGFHRYSVDARWIVPHFEKMAYDNGPLLETYARAASALDVERFREAAEGIVAHYEDVAPGLLEAGGFPASQDADFGFDNDGDYWTWTLAEAEHAAADPHVFEAAKLRFGLDGAAGSMHADPSRRVLYRARGPEDVGRAMGIDSTRAAELIDTAIGSMKAARDARPRPFVDETLYSGWVALVAAGHFAAARHAGVERAAAAAGRALRRVLNEAITPHGTLLHRVGDAASGEHLDDQAQAAHALIEAFEWTQDAFWLDAARKLASAMLRRFSDPQHGALRDRPADAPAAVSALEEAFFPIADSPTPAGNALAALTLTRLAAYTGDAAFSDAAARILRAFAGSAARLASSAATYMKALSWHVRPVSSLVVVEAEPRGPLLQEALSTYRPRLTVRRLEPGGEPGAGTPPEIVAMLTGDAPRAYLCVGRSCSAPIAEQAALRAALRSLRG
jgi:uncharacterized protein